MFYRLGSRRAEEIGTNDCREVEPTVTTQI
jgi:hypothetical protein